MSNTNYKEYGFADQSESHMHRHFMPFVFELAGKIGSDTRVLDVGCGNGATFIEFHNRGCQVTGIDLSRQGIDIARRVCPSGRFEVLPANDELLTNLDTPPFDLIISTEVVEHLYDPRSYAKGCFAALKEGGRFICTTPYHG
jgi:2-polyprenyl-3-methyl-5-hydroxy-6-metoxy-1,4-benzoquinol methylase